ncbi:TGF-beta receptor type-1-like [Acyrthosiphon pisum]|uniref:Receptor protein serine/threonine kinase n=1 Tax=Acyrthosiphon pisum TaxID=7029 RepID=A0A8R2B5B2_ACYPI|nr:TGF-beta receptor type-1-like [Acyrthosiphon pisum]|eukprot:XP_008182292.1 PREDICTED: TGF-beta receptor type-1-like [Acyrthosiphon pisum]
MTLVIASAAPCYLFVIISCVSRIVFTNNNNSWDRPSINARSELNEGLYRNNSNLWNRSSIDLPIELDEYSLGNRLPLELVDEISRGRYGVVWKALHKFENSWLIEQEIYQLPHMKHDNILSFIGAEERQYINMEQALSY